MHDALIIMRNDEHTTGAALDDTDFMSEWAMGCELPALQPEKLDTQFTNAIQLL
jgi:hypothetical protein